MESLKKAILERGTLEEGNILKVDTFLNHQIDVTLLNEIGKEFYERFKDDGINKILTLEASGIAIAVIAAQYFDVPVVFAKKVMSKNLDKEVYEAEVYSYTKGTTYTIRVSKKYLDSNDRVLIIDDFLAQGQAAFGLIDLVSQAGGSVAGVGVVIEKSFQEGGVLLRARRHKVESLAKIKGYENGLPVFYE